MKFERIQKEQIAVLDVDQVRRTRLVNSLSNFSCAFPLESIAELLRPIPRDAILFVHQGDHMIKEVINALANEGEWLPVVAYKENAEPCDVVSALRDGAINFLDLAYTSGSLRQFISKVRAQASEQTGPAEASMAAKQKLSLLSPREREVFDSVLAGSSNQSIAADLGVSKRTVECHRANALKKMGVRNTASAARIFLEAEMLSMSLV